MNDPLCLRRFSLVVARLGYVRLGLRSVLARFSAGNLVSRASMNKPFVDTFLHDAAIRTKISTIHVEL